jgi:hypothetical protein
LFGKRIAYTHLNINQRLSPNFSVNLAIYLVAGRAWLVGFGVEGRGGEFFDELWPC